MESLETARSRSTRASSGAESIGSWLIGHIPTRAVRLLRKVKTATRRSRAARRSSPVIEQYFPTATSSTVLAATGDTSVIRLLQRTEAPIILKLAHTPTASRQLECEAAALDELVEIVFPRSDEIPRIAVVQDRGTSPSGSWFSQSNLGGEPTSLVGLEPAQLVTQACEALEPFHDATANRCVVDAEIFEGLVGAPLSVLSTWRPELAEEFHAIQLDLEAAIGGRELTLCRLHGDFAPTNVLWDLRTSTVSGIVDWSFDKQALLPEIDLVHFALSLVMQTNRQEYGDVVLSFSHGTATPDEVAVVEAALRAGPNNLELQDAVALTWLHHVALGLQKQEQLRRNPIWRQRNVDKVVLAGQLLNR